MESDRSVNWQDAILEIIADNWRENQRVTPLSFLGSVLKDRGNVVLPEGVSLLTLARGVPGKSPGPGA